MTGLLGRLDLCIWTLELVNAGNVPPYLARDLGDLPGDVPFGLSPETTYRSTPLALETSDRVVIVTDGMLEHNAAGIELSPAIQETTALHPREAVRALADSVLRDRTRPQRRCHRRASRLAQPA